MYKIFIVDDEPFIIEGLYDIVDWAALGMEIVYHAENATRKRWSRCGLSQRIF